MAEMVYILGHKNPDVDSIVSCVLMQKVARALGKDAHFVVPDNDIWSESHGICLHAGIDTKDIYVGDLKPNAKYILVDHAEREVDGEIIQIIDHHLCETTAEIEARYPKAKIFNERSSSAALLVYQMYENLGIFTEQDILAVAIASAVDTISFKSSKATKEDENYVRGLCDKIGVNFAQVQKIGFCLTDISCPEDAVQNGLKYYKIAQSGNVKTMASAYIQVLDADAKTKQQFLKLAKQQCELLNVDYFNFIFHHLSETVAGNSELFVFEGKKQMYHNNMSHVASRGNEIIPLLKEVLSGACAEKITQ